VVPKSRSSDGRVSKLTAFLPIDDPSRVAEARRVAVALAREEGLDESSVANTALAATELATNLWKHAKGGEIHIARLSHHGTPGVDVLAIDRGPGIVSVAACLQDGISTTGTSGTGLGALSRISHAFDAYSEVGKGTVMLARIGGNSKEPDFVVGFSGRPIAGEEVSGDSWTMRQDAAGPIFIVADGLGHGIAASQASQEAVSTFRTSTETRPTVLLERIHRALRGTRGAAVAIAKVNRKERRVHYAGLGNISGIIVSNGTPQHMISHNGTAGHEARHFQEFTYSFPENAVLIMHSDGLATSWNLENYPGIQMRHPSVISGILYRDATRLRDDVCVVVARESTFPR
jgi:anti-sigma regulatory factor (Ser/Thr protein kinase)